MRVKLSPKLSSYIRCSPFLASAASDVDPQPGPSGRGRSRGGGRGKRGRGGAGGRKAAAAAAVDPTTPDQAATRGDSQPTGTKNQSFCALPRAPHFCVFLHGPEIICINLLYST